MPRPSALERTAASPMSTRRILRLRCAPDAGASNADDLPDDVARSMDVVSDLDSAVAQFEADEYAMVLVDADTESFAVAKALRRFETRESRHRIPMLTILQDERSGLLAEAIVSGCDDYLRYPISSESLEAAVSRWSRDEMGRPPLPDVHASMVDLIPDFLKRRGEDIHLLRSAFAEADFEAIAKIAHKVKGSGGSFGFPQLSEIGADLEVAARSKDREATESGIEGMAGVVDLYTATDPPL